MAHYITDGNKKRIKVAGSYSLKERQSFLLAHPIGSYYMSENSISPAELYGGGWEKVEGRFLLGASASYPAGQELGYEDATLPSHTHNQNISGVGAVTFASGGIPVVFGGSGTGGAAYKISWSYTNTTSGALYNGLPYAGSSATGKNMPPYRAVHIWYRYN